MGSVLITNAAKSSAIVDVNDAFTAMIAYRAKSMIEKLPALLQGPQPPKRRLSLPCIVVCKSARFLKVAP